jgi:hypothetical protein
MLGPFVGPAIASVNASASVGVVRHLFEPGQDIVKQGEVGRAMYIIQAGRVEVLQARDRVETRLAELGPGEHFGEIAVLKETRRSATVRALEQVALLRISRVETRLGGRGADPSGPCAGVAPPGSLRTRSRSRCAPAGGRASAG